MYTGLTMKKTLDALILEASNCNKKLTAEKDFKQVWFTRGEVVKLADLLIAETNAKSTFSDYFDGNKV